MRGLPQLQQIGSPTFRRAIQAMRQGQPVIDFLRPYSPDLVGWFRDFGQAAANYDANGHYARTSRSSGSSTSRTTAGGVLNPVRPRPAARRPRLRRRRRCPGAASQPRPTARTRSRRHGPRLRPEPRAPWPMTNVSATTKRWIAVGGLASVVPVVLGRVPAATAVASYRVRAIFDNAGFLVPGEDVKVAGVKVGTIESLEVTARRKAAVILRIEDPAFQDFRRDATCPIRLQSLIGEKFVACEPTQPESPSEPHAAAAPDRGRRRRGPVPAAGHEHLVARRRDLLNNIMRAPQRQRFAIILNELGVGLAGNGEELRGVVRRANPALQEFDKVLAILASQNRVLADLARDSDRALAATARESDTPQRLHPLGGRDGGRDRRARRRPGGQLRALPRVPAAAAPDGAPARRVRRRRDARDDRPGARPRRRSTRSSSSSARSARRHCRRSGPSATRPTSRARR